MVSRATTSSTVNLFLTGIGLCYLWAFMSLYPQIPGLYGPTGILPIHRLHKDHYSKSCLSMSWNDFKENPSIFCIVNDLKISPIYIMELCCLLGIILSSICIISHFIRHNLTFIIFSLLWLLYLSLYLVGQTFLSFQWDILLLECGFLCCFISSSTIYSQYNNIIFFCIRWLLFRLMFASFIVKLQSKCPTWWGLTALDWHYESTCIPTPASWYFHHLPKGINHLSVVLMYIIEGAFSILFILPIHFNSKYIFRTSRLIAGYSNIFLMILIQFTGNYNFFNILTIVITLPCFDDEHINYIGSKLFFWGKTQVIDAENNKNDKNNINKYILYMLYLIELIVWIGFILLIIKYFNLSVHKNDKNLSDYDGWFGNVLNVLNMYEINSKILFSETQMNLMASKFIMVAVIIGYINIICCIIGDFISNCMQFIRLLCGNNNNENEKMDCCMIILLIITFIYQLICYIIKIIIGIYIFHISLVPFLNGIDHYNYTQQYIINDKNMNYIRNELYFKSYKFHLVSSYGLFRRMTGVGGRPELEIFISGNDNPIIPFNEKHILFPPNELKNVTLPWDEEEEEEEENGWYRIPFLYKPGDLNSIPTWIAPHQPRLDWQMWFAALGNYQNNPWFISLLYRLITPQQSSAVYDLIDNKKYIFSPYFVTHLKKQKEDKEKAKKINPVKKMFQNVFGYVSEFIYGLSKDNEFDIQEKYYYKINKKKKKKKKKRKKKSKSKEILERIDYGYPKYITAILYDYHYTNILQSNVCLVDDKNTCEYDFNKGIWWTRERKREYFPIFKYNKLDSIRDWMKNNKYLNRPIFDGESEMNKMAQCIRFIRQFYRKVYHQKYDVVVIIYGLTFTVLILRFVHELIQNEVIGSPLS